MSFLHHSFEHLLQKVFKDEFSAFKHRSRRSINSGLVKKVDRMSRVLFPSVYIFLVLSYFCKYLD